MHRRAGRRVAGGVVLYALAWATNRSLRRVEGPSMRPTLQPGELVLVLPTWLVGVRRGSVVVVSDPRDRGRRTIKRVVGLPGERVQAAGRELAAGAGQLLVLGDDPTASTDSRVFGPVMATDVLAVAVAVVRPFRRLGPVPPTPTRRRPPRGTP